MSLQPGAREKHLVLIVDDDPAIRFLFARAFERNGIDTYVAENGREAKGLLERKHCDFCAVLLDLNIPAPDGIEIAKYIRDICSDLPVVVISGHPDLAERIADEDLGAVVKVILMKPVDTTFLAEYVHGAGKCLRTTGPQAAGS